MFLPWVLHQGNIWLDSVMISVLKFYVTLGIAGVWGLALTVPVRAERALTGAQIFDHSNRAELVSTSGAVRRAIRDEWFGSNDRLSTEADAQIDLLFNEGSLVRLGGLSQLSFWPETRLLRLPQGTLLMLVPSNRERLLVQTPNAVVGVHNNAVVVRHVPASQLTLVMALAEAAPGSVIITADSPVQQEIALAAGQMALVNGETIQVVEFDLLEFYATSRLAEGLVPTVSRASTPEHTSLAMLQSALLSAVEQQTPFSGSSPMLNPAVIRIHDNSSGLFNRDDDSSPLAPTVFSEEVRRYDDAPPGVITPLPPLDSGEPNQTEPLQEPNQPEGPPAGETPELTPSENPEPPPVTGEPIQTAD